MGEFNCKAEEFEEYSCNVISTLRLKDSKEATILGQLGEGRGAIYETKAIGQLKSEARTSGRM